MENRLDQVEKQLSEIKPKNSKSVITPNKIHNVSCSHCKKGPIVGYRYLCGNCNQSNLQFNLCDDCIKNREKVHYNNHFFIMIHDSSLWA